MFKKIKFDGICAKETQASAVFSFWMFNTDNRKTCHNKSYKKEIDIP